MRLGLSPFCEKPPDRTPKPDNAKIQKITWGGRGRDTEKWRDPQRENLPGADRDLGVGRGPQRGERTGTGTVADAGTRHGAQGRVAEVVGRRRWDTSRWAAICTRRGGGERVKTDRASKRNNYGWGGVRKEG